MARQWYCRAKYGKAFPPDEHKIVIFYLDSEMSCLCLTWHCLKKKKTSRWIQIKTINFILRIKKKFRHSEVRQSGLPAKKSKCIQLEEMSVVLPEVCSKDKMQGSSEGDFHTHSTMVLIPESTVFTWLFHLSSTPQVWVVRLLQCPF